MTAYRVNDHDSTSLIIPTTIYHIIFYLVCTNMDLVVTGERFECSCNTHYSTSNGTSEVLCDLQGPFYRSYSLWIIEYGISEFSMQEKEFMRFAITEKMIKLIWDECQLNIHTCHQFASCADLEVGYLCECWYPFIDLNGDGRTCIDFDECSDLGYYTMVYLSRLYSMSHTLSMLVQPWKTWWFKN